MKENFFKHLYKNMDKEEIIRIATEDKKRADRNAILLHKTIEYNKNIIEEKDKEIERLNKGCEELEKQVDDLYKLETTLTNEIERLHSIIKEVREEIIKDREKNYSNLEKKAFYCNKTDKLLEILDKENK